MARIDHPNAVRFLEAGVEEGMPWFAMELVRGRELFDVLAQERRLPEARAVAITLQICDAVATAHERGIIHRDLKPENVMLTGEVASAEGERVKLLDFGVGKQLAPRAGSECITMTGAVIGTPTYMAPEQGQGLPVDERSDVYACGALLYHLVTGSPPFEDESPVRTLFRHAYEIPRSPSGIVPGLDPALEAIILRALAKRPEDRPQRADVLWEELLAILPRLCAKSGHCPAALTPPRVAIPMHKPTWVVSATRPTPVSPARVRAPGAPSRRRVPYLVGLAAAAGVALTVLGWAAIPPASHASEAAQPRAHVSMLAR